MSGGFDDNKIEQSNLAAFWTQKALERAREYGAVTPGTLDIRWAIEHAIASSQYAREVSDGARIAQAMADFVTVRGEMQSRISDLERLLAIERKISANAWKRLNREADADLSIDVRRLEVICRGCDGTGWCEGTPQSKCERCGGCGDEGRR